MFVSFPSDIFRSLPLLDAPTASAQADTFLHIKTERALTESLRRRTANLEREIGTRDEELAQIKASLKCVSLYLSISLCLCLSIYLFLSFSVSVSLSLSTHLVSVESPSSK
jgi:hypothetical protein